MRKDMTKDRPRNRLMDYYIRGAPTYSRIVKVEHLPSETSPSGSEDLEPYVMYSMNKQKRWEIEPGTLDGNDVVVLEREIASCYSTWMCLQKHNFDEAYNCSRVLDARQLDSARKENRVIGYHIIRVPRNFKKIFDRKCFRYIGLRYPEFLGYKSKDLRPLDYELLEYAKELEDAEESVGNDCEGFGQNVEEPRHYYNWDDHIVVGKSKGKH